MREEKRSSGSEEIDSDELASYILTVSSMLNYINYIASWVFINRETIYMNI